MGFIEKQILMLPQVNLPAYQFKTATTEAVVYLKNRDGINVATSGMMIMSAITTAVISTIGMIYLIIFVIVVSQIPILINKYDPTGGVWDRYPAGAQ